jgi:conjugative relaxase-like TrwC/TraI family protein
MLTISKPLSAGQAASYHATEFTSAEQSYYTQGNQIRGEWQGKLAEEYGLTGEVSEQAFTRLAAGQHPETAEQLVRYQQAREIVNETGEVTKTLEHRAGWDATFSAPKSVSLTALVGGDERVREAHREAVRTALDEMEHYVQARIGGNAPAETSGKWIVAKFEHDSARPVDGYAAPQLHTHAVFFNMTETEDGKAHAVQPQELYRSQQYATAIYQSELAWRLKEFGYEIEPGKNGAPEIRGYSQEYLEASSPRSQQIKEHLAEQGVNGAGAAQIAAHRTRDAKLALTPDEMLVRHRDMAEAFGNQPERVTQAAKEKMYVVNQEHGGHDHEARLRPAQSAVTFARDRNMEREAVVDERALMRDALKRSMGQATFADVQQRFEERVEKGDLIEVKTAAGRSFTTPEMMTLERDNIEHMKSGQDKYTPMVEQRMDFEHLSNGQRQAVDTILESRDQITGLQGAAGAGKTTSLAALREAAEKEGYTVEGLAPTSRAAYQLEEAGIKSTTLQHHLAQGDRAHDGGKHLYFVDESSLASTKQVHEFFERLKENERVVLVGDTRQHQAVDAGRPFEQLQDAGMRTARLDDIVRQKDPALKETVEQLARGEVREAIDAMDRQGRVHEISDPQERMREIARDYAERPEGTLVISPDNKSRMALNGMIHRELQERGAVAGVEHQVKVLIPRQDMTGADRAWAAQYETGDVVRYTKGSRAMGIGAGEYARVAGFDAERNQLTVERENGESVSYDPRRLQGVTVYRESERAFSEGDRVQFTAPDREHKIANRELGTIGHIDERGSVDVKLDSGREAHFNVRDNPHLDHGYAVTSHSSQGATADRVLIHVDSESAHEKLINSRLAYVAVSRARYDAQIYTNDAGNLGKALSREVSHAAAVDDWKHEDNGAASGIHSGGQRGTGYGENSAADQGHAAQESQGHEIAMER